MTTMERFWSKASRTFSNGDSGNNRVPVFFPLGQPFMKPCKDAVDKIDNTQGDPSKWKMQTLVNTALLIFTSQPT